MSSGKNKIMESVERKEHNHNQKPNVLTGRSNRKRLRGSQESDRKLAGIRNITPSMPKKATRTRTYMGKGGRYRTQVVSRSETRQHWAERGTNRGEDRREKGELGISHGISRLFHRLESSDTLAHRWRSSPTRARVRLLSFSQLPQ